VINAAGPYMRGFDLIPFNDLAALEAKLQVRAAHLLASCQRQTLELAKGQAHRQRLSAALF
jgi:hypothetical protein